MSEKQKQFICSIFTVLSKLKQQYELSNQIFQSDFSKGFEQDFNTLLDGYFGDKNSLKRAISKIFHPDHMKNVPDDAVIAALLNVELNATEETSKKIKDVQDTLSWCIEKKLQDSIYHPMGAIDTSSGAHSSHSKQKATKRRKHRLQAVMELIFVFLPYLNITLAKIRIWMYLHWLAIWHPTYQGEKFVQLLRADKNINKKDIPLIIDYSALTEEVFRDKLATSLGFEFSFIDTIVNYLNFEKHHADEAIKASTQCASDNYYVTMTKIKESNQWLYYMVYHLVLMKQWHYLFGVWMFIIFKIINDVISLFWNIKSVISLLLRSIRFGLDRLQLWLLGTQAGEIEGMFYQREQKESIASLLEYIRCTVRSNTGLQLDESNKHLLKDGLSSILAWQTKKKVPSYYAENDFFAYYRNIYVEKKPVQSRFIPYITFSYFRVLANENTEVIYKIFSDADELAESNSLPEDMLCRLSRLIANLFPGYFISAENLGVDIFKEAVLYSIYVKGELSIFASHSITLENLLSYLLVLVKAKEAHQSDLIEQQYSHLSNYLSLKNKSNFIHRNDEAYPEILVLLKKVKEILSDQKRTVTYRDEDVWIFDEFIKLLEQRITLKLDMTMTVYDFIAHSQQYKLINVLGFFSTIVWSRSVPIRILIYTVLKSLLAAVSPPDWHGKDISWRAKWFSLTGVVKIPMAMALFLLSLPIALVQQALDVVLMTIERIGLMLLSFIVFCLAMPHYLYNAQIYATDGYEWANAGYDEWLRMAAWRVQIKKSLLIERFFVKIFSISLFQYQVGKGVFLLCLAYPYSGYQWAKTRWDAWREQHAQTSLFEQLFLKIIAYPMLIVASLMVTVYAWFGFAPLLLLLSGIIAYVSTQLSLLEAEYRPLNNHPELKAASQGVSALSLSIFAAFSLYFTVMIGQPWFITLLPDILLPQMLVMRLLLVTCFALLSVQVLPLLVDSVKMLFAESYQSFFHPDQIEKNLYASVREQTLPGVMMQWKDYFSSIFSQQSKESQAIQYNQLVVRSSQ